jgi:hypothetical protein
MLAIAPLPEFHEYPETKINYYRGFIGLYKAKL